MGKSRETQLLAFSLHVTPKGIHKSSPRTITHNMLSLTEIPYTSGNALKLQDPGQQTPWALLAVVPE